MDHLFITVVIFLVSLMLANHFRRKYSNLPPTIFPTIPIIGHLYLMKRPVYRTFAKISAKHGPILLLRFGFRRVLLVSSPSISEECFTKNDIIFAARPRLIAAKILAVNYTNVAASSYGDHWRNLRKISASNFFSTQRLNELQDERSEEGRFLVRKLISECSSPVNLKSVFNEFTLNLMMRLIVGKRDHLPFLKWFGVNGLENKLIALQKKRDAFAQGLIDRLRKVRRVEVLAKDTKINKNTMILVLLQLQETDPEYYTDELIKNYVLVR
ncbi:cytochrome P450 [Artemisia annua]|uniref:Cytochrome P450 n=1 Tax=Artemisia annua TaxID=35608 RepID=A0A2U1MT78_ARTAN|nr:cytochrome P450 [Artemisia annua]